MKSKERKSPHHSFLGSLFVFFFSVVTIFSSNIEPIGRTFLYGVIGAAPWCTYIFLYSVCHLFGSNNLLLLWWWKGSNTMLMVHKRGILVNFIHVTYLAHILHLKIARKWHSWSDFVINDVLSYVQKMRK